MLAFGSPFGLNQTVTHGIISATNRGQISLGSTIRIKEFLQTDAAINPGSSGGPLVDLDGKVVGINTAIASKSGSNSGVSFSIPANMVKRIAAQLIEKGAVTRGYLGVQLATALEPAEALRLGLNRVSGALVEIVHPNTPAAAAGLRVGDVILQIEDVAVRDENHLINVVWPLPPGQKVKLTVWRDRKAAVCGGDGRRVRGSEIAVQQAVIRGRHSVTGAILRSRSDGPHRTRSGRLRGGPIRFSLTRPGWGRRAKCGRDRSLFVLPVVPQEQHDTRRVRAGRR